MTTQRFGLPLVALIAATLMVGVTFGFGLRSVVDGPPDAQDLPGKVDIGFAQDMAVHHEQAVLMAQQAERSGGPLVQSLASTIVQSQSQEIGIMRGWLLLWDKPQLASGAPMTWMSGGHHGGTDRGTTMPGMATSAQLEKLASLRGDAFDAYFCQLMVAHHNGGIVMADAAVSRAGMPRTRELARRIVIDQTNEVGEMSAIQRTVAS